MATDSCWFDFINFWVCAKTCDFRVAVELSWEFLDLGWVVVTRANDLEIESSWMVGSSSSDERLAKLAGGRDIFLFSTTL